MGSGFPGDVDPLALKLKYSVDKAREQKITYYMCNKETVLKRKKNCVGYLLSVDLLKKKQTLF